MAVSLIVSMSFHVLVLAVLALAVHPFQLPDTEQAIDVQLLPPLQRLTEETPVELRPTPPDATVLPLRGLRARPPEHLQPKAPAPDRTEPEPLPQPPQTQAQTPPQPQELVRPELAPRQKAIDLDRTPTVQNRRLNQAKPVQEFTPDDEAPDLSNAQLAAKPKAVDLNRPSTSRSRSLSQSRPDQEFRAAEPEAQASDAVKTAPTAPVLTNDSTIQAPVEIRAPERKAQAPPPGSGAPAGGGPLGGGGSGGQQGGGQAGSGQPGSQANGQGTKPRAWDYGGPALRGGLSMRLGCLNPETYKLTAAEKAACLDRFGAQARGARELGLNIPDAKQAEYDRQTACRRAYRDQGFPGSNDPSDGGSIRGLGTNPSLKACGPGDR
jgi:hypothetical protein